MAKETDRLALADAAALWSVDAIASDELISTACDALVAGLDSEGLRQLAAMPPRSLSDDLTALVEQTAEELRFPFSSWGSAAVVAAAQVMATRCLAGAVPPRELVRSMHDVIGHTDHPSLERLVRLDDEYELTSFTGRALSDIDQAVRDAAAALLEEDPRSATATDEEVTSDETHHDDSSQHHPPGIR